jgi:hypothetical protein
MPYVRAGLLMLALTMPRAVAAGAPLEVRVKELHTPANTVSTTVELRDVLPDRFRKLVDDGGVLHLRIQTELWQRRSTWDRLVFPGIVRVLRLTRVRPGQDIAVTDPAGEVSTYAVLPNPMPVVVQIGSPQRLNPSDRYYVHTVATLGTLAEHEADDASAALFGRESESGTLGSLGRMVFRRVLQISDYLQSVSAEVTSGPVQGREILAAR